MSHTRPSISLCMIVKNEEKHMNRLLPQLMDLFDEIVITDTGSTDKTLEILNEYKEKYPDKMIIGHFDWVNDFAKARQHSMDLCTKDYVMWLDSDDEIVNVEEFKRWRDYTMHSAEYWLINYDYAQDKNGNSVCQFVRERVVKNNGVFVWKYPIHEGLVPKEGHEGRIYSQKSLAWEIKHVRDAEDMEQDRNRNVGIFESFIEQGIMDDRLNFYYGKELFDIGEKKKAAKYLMEAAQSETTAMTDRIMAIQYCAQSAYESEAYTQAEQLSLNGIQLLPNRAEFWCILGDVALKRNQPKHAMIYYKAARECEPANLSNTIFHLPSAYGDYPTFQIAKIMVSLGLLDEAKKEAEGLEASDSKNQLVDYIEKTEKVTTINPNAKEIDEVIISVPPSAYGSEWDEKALETKGLGGSETAAVEVARSLVKNFGINAKVFNMREEYMLCDSGAEYIPVKELGQYLQRYKPKFHIAWRHAVNLGSSPMFTWSHDLQTPGSEKMEFNKILALSEFHKHYLHDTQGVDLDKIAVFRNGIDPKLWDVEKPEKNPMKVIFSSSPDRGLERCINICKKVREMGTPVEFHCFYGFENMRKCGLGEWADRLEALIEDNKDFVHYHGNVDKPTLVRHFMESAVWLYPADFIETYCITVLEALGSGCYPMVREMGALPYTLASAAPKDMYFMTDKNCETEDELSYWAENLQKAVLEKRYEKVNIDLGKHSWTEVTRDLIGLMEKEGVNFGNSK